MKNVYVQFHDNRIYISDIPVYRYADALLMMAGN